MYRRGIIDDLSWPNDIDSLNHAVLVVGYETDADTNIPYWIIQNSWGPDVSFFWPVIQMQWGENGLFRIKRGVNLGGIAHVMIYPDLTGRHHAGINSIYDRYVALAPSSAAAPPGSPLRGDSPDYGSKSYTYQENVTNITIYV